MQKKHKVIRQLTGVGFEDCDSAMIEADDDINKAIEILRVAGTSKATKEQNDAWKLEYNWTNDAVEGGV